MGFKLVEHQIIWLKNKSNCRHMRHIPMLIGRLIQSWQEKWFNEHTHCIVVILSHPHFISFYPIKFLVYWWLYHILMFPFVVANPSLISQIRMEMDGNIPMTSWSHPHCWLYTSCLTINTCIFCGGTMNKKEHIGQVSWPYTYIYIIIYIHNYIYI